MRTFISLDIPEEFRKYMQETQQQIKGASCTFPKEFHVTLKFLGDVDESMVEEVKQRLLPIKFNQFMVSFSNIGCFPNEKYIRVIWIGIEPAKKIIALQQEVEKALQGLFPKERDFTPHITLARVKFAGDRERLQKSIREIKVKPDEFIADCIKLKKSTLTPQGPVYENIFSVPLSQTNQQ